ncbi:uncharacterized protein [Nicotiana tomentosiformis]|uniref:uncharacterized protein n=1 Tax=Nicotiana tomentosiformis TaxID=4098 RepID=UPI00388CA78F
MEKIRRFLYGLNYGLRYSLAQEAETDARFDKVVVIVRQLEHDHSCTYSYVSSYFARYLDMPNDSLDMLFYVSTPVGDSIMVDYVYRSCVVTIRGNETKVDLLLLSMIDFEVIFCMDWLSPYHVILDYHAKTVTLAMPGLPRLEWRDYLGHTPSRVNSYLKAQQMVEKGCLAYLDIVRNVSVDTPIVEQVPIVREFPYVFPSGPSMVTMSFW